MTIFKRKKDNTVTEKSQVVQNWVKKKTLTIKKEIVTQCGPWPAASIIITRKFIYLYNWSIVALQCC